MSLCPPPRRRLCPRSASLLLITCLAVAGGGCASTVTPVAPDNPLVDYGPDVLYPDEWPADFPITDESVLLVAAQPEGVVSVIIRTPELYEDVVEFYDEELAGPYRVQSRESGNFTTRWQLHSGGVVEVINSDPTEIGVELPTTS
jgi:hypothetical protein